MSAVVNATSPAKQFEFVAGDVCLDEIRTASKR